MSEYTKGSWELVEGELDGLWEAAIYAPADGTICRLDDEMLGCRDNARLIAAAPDLLEACKLLLAQTLKFGVPHPTSIAGREVEAARAAIAKATGA